MFLHNILLESFEQVIQWVHENARYQFTTDQGFVSGSTSLPKLVTSWCRAQDLTVGKSHDYGNYQQHESYIH